MSQSFCLSYGEEVQELSGRIRRLPAGWLKVRKSGGWAGTSQIVEVRSGAMIPETYRPGLSSLEVNTDHGSRRFEYEQETSKKDAQSEATDEGWERKRILILHWTAKDNPWPVLIMPATRPQALSQPTPGPSFASRQLSRAPSTESQDDNTNELSAGVVLHSLQDASLQHQDRRRLIIEAEVMDFGPQELALLNALLREFIARYRESNDPEDLVAVNAAIRKCVATMSADDALAYTARLLEAGPRAAVAPDIELELAKMVLRKLTANPPRHPNYLPELADRLFEVASVYLNPRLLARENYGAITVNAVLGLVLLRSRNIAELFQLLSGLNVPWFQQLLARRSGRLRDELRKRFPGERLEELIALLSELEVRIQTSGK